MAYIFQVLTFKIKIVLDNDVTYKKIMLLIINLSIFSTFIFQNVLFYKRLCFKMYIQYIVFALVARGFRFVTVAYLANHASVYGECGQKTEKKLTCKPLRYSVATPKDTFCSYIFPQYYSNHFCDLSR